MSWVYSIAGIAAAGAVAAVIYWIRGLLSDRVTLAQRDAALRVADERIAAQERAAAEQMAARAKEFDEKASQVRNAADALRLLHEQTSRTRKPG